MSDWESGIGSAQIKADSDRQEARMDALAAKRAERKPTEDYEDHIRQWLEDYIDYGVSIGKFATVDDAPDIDAYFETLDNPDGEVLPQDRGVKIEGIAPIRGRHDR